MSIEIEYKVYVGCDTCGKRVRIRPDGVSAICNSLDHDITVSDIGKLSKKWSSGGNQSSDFHQCPECYAANEKGENDE